MIRVRDNWKGGGFSITKIHKDGRTEYDGGRMVFQSTSSTPSTGALFGFRYGLVASDTTDTQPLTITWTLNLG